MIKLTPTARIILGFLQLGARTGYDIKHYVDVSTRFFWGASYGQIYPELRRLAEAGLVRPTSQPRGGLARTEYTVTAKGRKALHDWLRKPPGPLLFEYRDEALLRLFFGDLMTPEEVAINLRQAREEFEHDAVRFRELQAQGLPSGYPAAALRYGIELMEWIAAWYRDAEQRLAAGELAEDQASS
jgi:DNA-binding PadR family transcriptional regulator